MKIDFSYEKMSTKTCFEKEAWGNSEMAYSHLHDYSCMSYSWNKEFLCIIYSKIKHIRKHKVLPYVLILSESKHYKQKNQHIYQFLAYFIVSKTYISQIY